MDVNEINRFFKMSQEVYANLADPISKAIFLARMNYNISKSTNYILDMVSMNPRLKEKEYQKLKSLIERLRRIDNQLDARLIIYGAGRYGETLKSKLSEFEWYAFCDKDTNKHGTMYCNLPVISPEELVLNHKSDYIVISSPQIYEEVNTYLLMLGFSADQIIYEHLPFEDIDNQYFEASIVTPQPNEVFIDAGCYDCETSLLFREWCGGDYDKIYAFEPDTINFQNCQSIIKREQIQNMELLNAGVWSSDNRLQFDDRGDMASSIDSKGTNSIYVRSIDSVLQGARATFIKMDIEGAELEALKGASKTIAKYRPKLAICVYHKPEDMLLIQLYLQSIVPDYQFYIRHYGDWYETILYAV